MTEEQRKVIREVTAQMAENNKSVAEIIKDCQKKDTTIFWMRLILLLQAMIIIFLSIRPIHF